ncbi:hypothetical protein [Amycolatopsis sp. cmx-4-54]|uniref:hypothetical protein n=1 Tax=Amycolatopsis sp. cmx-4-54 TaxID=2790936 RepID=UPI00397AB8FB
MMSDPVPDEHAPYADEARARLAVSAAARELSDSARGFVPISPGSLDQARHRPQLLANEIEVAARLVDQAELVLETLLGYAAVSGATWEVLGEGLGMARQNANGKYRGVVKAFRAGLDDPDRDDDAGRWFQANHYAAIEPDRWAPRLDAWMEHHREPTEGVPPTAAVSGGLTRLGPLAEWIAVGNQRSALLHDYLVPPADKVLPLAERELQLLRQLAAAGHDVAEDVTRMEKKISELRATLPATEPADTSGEPA